MVYVLNLFSLETLDFSIKVNSHFKKMNRSWYSFLGMGGEGKSWQTFE